MAKEPKTMLDFLPPGVSDIRLDFTGSTLGLDKDTQAQWLNNISQVLAEGMAKTHGIQALKGQFAVDQDDRVSLTMTVFRPLARPQLQQQAAPQEAQPKPEMPEKGASAATPAEP